MAMYLVVEFQLTDEVAMVSEKWLSNDKTEVMWPNFKSSFKFEIALKQHKNPEANWTKWGVKRILYKTNVFEKALQKAKEAEDESDIQTDIEAVIPVQEKRKKRPNPRFVSSSDSDSASEEDVCPVPPPQIRLPTVSTPCSLFPSALASSSSHVPSALPTSSRIAPSALPSSLSHVPSALPTSSRIAPSALPTSSRIVQSALPTSSRCVPVFTTSSRSVPSATPTTSSRVQSRPPTQSSSSRGTNEISERDIRIMRGMEEIKAEQKEIKAMLATVLQRLDVTHRDCQVPEGIKLPLCTLEEMEENEGMLQDSTVFKMMVDHLSSIGGSSVKNMTKRVMKAVMKNSLAQDYNWTGARNKLSFDCLKLSSAIIRAVKRNFAGSDHSVTEFYVKDWLRNARDRDGGRMKRMKHSNNITAEDNDYN